MGQEARNEEGERPSCLEPSLGTIPRLFTLVAFLFTTP